MSTSTRFSSDRSDSESENVAHPVLILSFEKKRGRNAIGEFLSVDSNAIDKIAKKGKDLPAVILAVTGEAESGKSLLANLLLRNFAIGDFDEDKLYEISQEESVPKGFVSKRDSGTRGIYMWNEPMIFRTEEKSFAIYIIDSAGSSISAESDLEKLVDLSTLVSSKLFYNVQVNKNGRISFNSVALLANAVSQFTDNGEHKGQSLNFVIRDSEEEETAPNLQAWLFEHFAIVPQLPSPTSLQTEPDAKTDGRERILQIKNCFEENSCTQLSYPYTTNSTKLTATFRNEVCDFMKRILQDLRGKQILQTDIPSVCLPNLFQEAAKMVNESEARSPALNFTAFQKLILQPMLEATVPKRYEENLKQFVQDAEYGFRETEELKAQYDSFLEIFLQENGSTLDSAGRKAIKAKISKTFQTMNVTNSKVLKELSMIPDWEQKFLKNCLNYHSVLVDSLLEGPITNEKAEEIDAEIADAFRNELGSLAIYSKQALVPAMQRKMKLQFRNLNAKVKWIRTKEAFEKKFLEGKLQKIQTKFDQMNLKNEILQKFQSDLQNIQGHSLGRHFVLIKDLEAAKTDLVSSIPPAEFKSADLKPEDFQNIFEIVKDDNDKNAPIIGIVTEGAQLTQLVVKVVAFYANKKVVRVSFLEELENILDMNFAKQIVESIQKTLQCGLTGVLLIVPTIFLQNQAQFLAMFGGSSRPLFLKDHMEAHVMTGFLKAVIMDGQIYLTIIVTENSDKTIDFEIRRSTNGIAGQRIIHGNRLSTILEVPTASASALAPILAPIKQTLYEVRSEVNRFKNNDRDLLIFINLDNNGPRIATRSSRVFNYFQDGLLPCVATTINHSEIRVGVAGLGEAFRRQLPQGHLSIELVQTPGSFEVANLELCNDAQNTP